MSNQFAGLDAALKIHLLLVDDESEFKEIMQKHLGRAGIRLSVSGSCFEALELLEDQRLDVVIMDMNMPGMDGIQCLRKIKEHWPLVEVIILTGHASVQSGIEGMESGAFDYCLKPIDVRELIEKVELAAQKALINLEDKTL
ncbi:response regulator [Desulfobulbus oligotrophicus]|jgi:DNA-binding NtrC family response regulator|uniref:Response regulator n=1 Tax=Desulfobulbus oligotrophicus TaxID=1909699 RepID=A0A7T6AQ11_9BACT|nr:response regulator [Desulfobulbus oligotrophicus]MDY0390020.1 response regulator [Desulfobulbus oligotrophicus]QQG64985.1 response regulator [Desulfobulbus oligotrophicus]